MGLGHRVQAGGAVNTLNLTAMFIDDEHSHGQMARAAACYALAGSSAPNDGTAALLVSLACPWDEQWWKPSTARRDLIKAGALILAEIERIDRVAASQGGPSDA